jgi:hypothetical protein
MAVAMATAGAMGCSKHQGETGAAPAHQEPARPERAIPVAVSPALAHTGNPMAMAAAPRETEPEDVPATSELTLIDRGSAPRRMLAYSFSPGQRDKLRITLRLSTSRDVGRLPASVVSGKTPELIGLDVVASSPARSGHPRFWIATNSDVGVPAELTLQAAQSLPATPGGPSASAAPASMHTHSLDGLRAAIDLDPKTGGVRIFFVEGYVPPSHAEELLAALRYALESLFVAFPADEVGKGAKWERVIRAVDDDDGPSSTKTDYQLKELGATSAVVAVTSRRDSSKGAAAGGPGELAVEASYVQTIRFDRLPSRVAGEWVTTISLGPATPPSRPPQAKTTVSELIENLAM